MELKDKVAVVTGAVGPAGRNALFQSVLLGRLGEPKEYAALAVHLASDDNYSVGQIITPNGGLVM